jgi:ribonuclease D
MSYDELKDPIWVDTLPVLKELALRLAAGPAFAVDTESNSLFAYREQVCLVQITTFGGDDYVIDPLAIKDLSPLGPLFADESIQKVFHAGEYDLICLKRDFGFEFRNLFDTMIAARILGREVVGLSAMVEAEFGIALDKKWQRANWGIRPMPPAQLAYARMDSHFLIPLRDIIQKELAESGRTALAEEDFHRLERTPVPLINGEKDTIWKIVGRTDINTHQMAVLQRLYEYRDSQARRANLPPFKIMTNDTLVAIAQALPKLPEELESIPGLSPKLRERHGNNLLECVAKGLASEPLKRPRSPRKDDELIERLETLKTWRKTTAAHYHVESDVILPREVVEQVAGVNPKSFSELSALMVHFPWRLEQFGQEILQTLKPGEQA